MSNDYDALIEVLNEMCKKNGKATAKVGQDFVIMLSENYLLTLLAAARNDKHKRAVVVVIDSENVKPKELPN